MMGRPLRTLKVKRVRNKCVDPQNGNNKTTIEKKFDSLITVLKVDKQKRKEETPHQPTCNCKLTRDKRLSYE